MIRIFDTTMRDGEQAPGIALTPDEKVEIAHHLAELNTDVIEAGFPITSPGDFEAVERISNEVKGSVIATLSRTEEADIDCAAEASRDAERMRLHIVVSTSPIHMNSMLQKNQDEVIEMSTHAIRHARQYTDDIEFSCQDATRSDPEFVCRVVDAAIDAGATTINIADTVGYIMPSEMSALIQRIRNSVPNIDQAVLSVHCHNDLGLAVANSLAAIEAGARQVEVAINGIGERAGNTSYEEVVMSLITRKDYFNLETRIDTTHLAETSRRVSELTGVPVQPNKAVVGANAFAHESGIHQDGVLKERTTYEIMQPEDIGRSGNRLVLGKHSGRHAFRAKLTELGYHLHELDPEAANRAFKQFKAAVEQEKHVPDDEVERLIKTAMTEFNAKTG